jgi:trigger factor
MEKETDGEINVTFPEKYKEDLAGKNAVFKVRIHSIREPQYPDLDDEFAKDVSEFDTLQDYRNDLTEKLVKERHESAENEFKSALILKAVENATCDVPESMIREKIDGYLRNYAESLGLRGNISKQDIIKMMGIDERQFAAMMRPNALSQVKADLLLEKIVEVENIEVGQDEKDEFYQKVEEDYGEESQKIRDMIDERLMVRDLARRKAAELIFGSAVKKAPGEAEAPAEAVPEKEEQD